MQFRIGSTTKTMIGTSILILVDKGQLKLNDTVEKILPGLISHGSAITIEALLSHNSRLINYTGLDDFTDTYVNNPTYAWTKDEIINLFKDKDLIETSDLNDSFYSNSNFYLLGMIIEKISGTSLDNFLYTNIFKPLKMNNTYLPVNSFITGNFSDGYMDLNIDGIFQSNERITAQSPVAIWAAGAVISTLPDLAIWMEELINGTLISEGLQKKRMEFNWHVHGAPEGVDYSLGLANQFGQIGHTGAVAGYTTIMFNYKGNDIIAYTNGYYLDPAEPNVPGQMLDAVVKMIDGE